MAGARFRGLVAYTWERGSSLPTSFVLGAMGKALTRMSTAESSTVPPNVTIEDQVDDEPSVDDDEPSEVPNEPEPYYSP
jgi:hypothetical protein